MKKTFSILLCCVLVCLTFFGCSDSGKDKSGSNTDLKFTYDSAYTSMDESSVSAYEALCTAIVNGEDSARLNLSMLDDVFRLYYTSFPLSALVDKLEESEDGSGLTITYKFSKDEHLEKVAAFEAKVKEIEEYCYNSTVNKNIYAIRLYNYVASSIKESENASITCYDSIMTGEGTANSYANMFEYLLLQADIPAYHILATDNGGAAWSLSQAELNGKLFYFDMMTEHYMTGGQQLQYFGMTSEDVANEGLIDMTYTDSSVAYDADSLDYDICRSCKGWEIDGAKLLITSTNGNVVEIAL